MTTFYDLSGGMESAAMVYMESAEIKRRGHIVRFADTGKHFPEMAESLKQIETILDIPIVIIQPRITFDEFLFEKGGIIRKGTTDCSRRMKRGNLARHMKTYPKPYTVNLGFNCEETQRAEDFIDRNEREWLHWRFPLIEAKVTREDTVKVCKFAGFTILVEMYEKMGRFDCYWCGNQRPSQAEQVVKHYPELAKEWDAAEKRKGHSFMRIPIATIMSQTVPDSASPSIGCACFGGNESVADEIEAEVA